VRIKLILIIISIFNVLFAQDTLTYRIEIMKDTVYIEEPIIIKCRLINNSGRSVRTYSYPSTSLLSFGYNRFFLIDSYASREYRYGVYSHELLLVRSDTFLLAPQDSVYYYTILSWSGFVSLNQDGLKPGYYRIKAEYFSLNSNVDSFYAMQLPVEERVIFDKVGSLIDEYWSWPEACSSGTKDRIREIMPDVIKNSSSVFTPFCYYMLWRMSFSDDDMANSLVDEFLKLYPDSPLAEKFTFDLFRYYGWYKKDEDKGREVILDALRKYPNNLIGYFYLDLRSKEEGLK